MKCCQGQCVGIERQFNARQAQRELRAFQKKGPSRTTTLLVQALREQGVEGLTLLDIGGGIGTIQHLLLAAGVPRATDVDASTGYLAAARAESERQGQADRVRYLHGNFVEIADQIAPADIVTLDRVICCYPDMPALVGQSAAKAGKLYGVVYPRDVWWMRLGVIFIDFMLRLRRFPFQVFVHHTAAVEAVICERGLERRFYRTTGPWQVAVYVRGTAEEQSAQQ